MISNVLIIFPPNYPSSQCLFDVGMSFSKSLQELGHEAVLTISPEDCSGTTLVFGAHLLPKFEGTIEGDYILYQTEQLGANDSLFADDKYLDILKRFPVWDYSTNNIEYLKTKGIEAKYVPIGYHPVLENIRKNKSVTLMGGGTNGEQRVDYAPWSGIVTKAEDIDVCWFGSMNDRRKKIIDELKGLTIHEPGKENPRPLVVASFVGFSGYRDKLVARSKIVLNMHYYDTAIFEIFRCSHLMANKKCIVSEFGKDKELEESFYEGISFTDYNGLVKRVFDLIPDSAARGKIAQGGYNAFKRKTQKEILTDALA